MLFLAWVALYLLAALSGSLVAPRLHRIFATERGIFRLHLGSFLLVSGAAAAYGLAQPTEERLAAAVAAVAAHGIFSLSYLELWSLTEGSYSLRMILALREGPIDRNALVAGFADLGNHKRESRIDALQGLGLVGRKGDALVLTPRGRFAAQALQILLAAANITRTA